MTGYQKRNLTRSIVIGLAATLVVVLAALIGLLDILERPLSDRRATWCQFHTPEPTDQLIHLDIDDNALEDIHSWPWPRGIWAQILDELRLAGSRTVAFDVMFTEPQQDGQSTDQELENDDVRFARAIAAHGRVILPVNLTLTPENPRHRQAINAMIAQPELIQKWDNYRAAMSDSDPTAPPTITQDDYLIVRRRALYELLSKQLHLNRYLPTPLTLERAREMFFPDADPALTSSPQMRLLEKQFAKAQASQLIYRGPVAFRAPRDMMVASDIAPPIASLGAWILHSGFVNVIPDRDGVVRHVPVVIKHNDVVYTQLGVALAQLHLSDDTHRIIAFEGQSFHYINLPLPSIPTNSKNQVLIPWTGPQQDWQGVVGHRQHVAIGYVWEAARLARSIDTNRATADRAINDLYRLALDPAKVITIDPDSDAWQDDQARAQRIASVLEELASLGYPDALKDTPAAQLSEQEQTILAAIAAIRVIPEQLERLHQLLQNRRAELRERLTGKAVLIGWTASGLGDVITTPLHTRSPGVIAHGAVFNGILTSSFKREAGPLLWLPLVLLMGAIGTALAIVLGPGYSATAVSLLSVLYGVINGLVLYDWQGLQLPLAAPVLALATAWLTCMLSAFVFERRERARITRRFQNYVDPTLVSYVIENPDKARLEGEARTMTVVFTDLEGFTRLSSTIHERVVPVINRYLEQMIPPIHEHRGYVNKFLGDGIMFFFGAPRENDRHAQNAIAAIMEMQKRMGPFNESLAAEGLPSLSMRVGMTTGRMIVGDAGSGQRSDYTVMGDQVNLAARLESANKACGTSILINDTAAEMIQDQYLLRPVGRLQVVGRSEAVMCFEPLCPLKQASYPQKKMVELTHKMIQAYTEQRWDDCLNHAQELAKIDKVCSKLADLYRHNVALQRDNPSPGFDGRIELTSK